MYFMLLRFYGKKPITKKKPNIFGGNVNKYSAGYHKNNMKVAMLVNYYPNRCYKQEVATQINTTVIK